MSEFTQTYKKYLSNGPYMASVALGVFLLVASFIINYYAGLYATEIASNYVNDIILNNIPVFDVDVIFVYGPLVMWVMVAAICIRKPQAIPFVLKSIALFVLIRSLFITLTHLGPFPDQLQIETGVNLVRKFTFGGDLFFSGHTGSPFLMAVIFWNNRRLRFIFTAIAILFGTVVLLAHLHYSIDVLAAFFITYTIAHMAEHFFKADHEIFKNGLSSPHES